MLCTLQCALGTWSSYILGETWSCSSAGIVTAWQRSRMYPLAPPGPELQVRASALFTILPWFPKPPRLGSSILPPPRPTQQSSLSPKSCPWVSVLSFALPSNYTWPVLPFLQSRPSSLDLPECHVLNSHWHVHWLPPVTETILNHLTCPCGSLCVLANVVWPIPCPLSHSCTQRF